MRLDECTDLLEPLLVAYQNTVNWFLQYANNMFCCFVVLGVGQDFPFWGLGRSYILKHLLLIKY